MWSVVIISLLTKGSQVKGIYTCVAGSISGFSWGTYKRQPIDVSFSHWCLSSHCPLSLSPSLPTSALSKYQWKKYPQMKINKKKFFLSQICNFIQLLINISFHSSDPKVQKRSRDITTYTNPIRYYIVCYTKSYIVKNWWLLVDLSLLR